MKPTSFELIKLIVATQLKVNCEQQMTFNSGFIISFHDKKCHYSAEYNLLKWMLKYFMAVFRHAIIVNSGLSK